MKNSKLITIFNSDPGFMFVNKMSFCHQKLKWTNLAKISDLTIIKNDWVKNLAYYNLDQKGVLLIKVISTF